MTSLTYPISLENIDLTTEWVVEAEDGPLLDENEVEVADAVPDDEAGDEDSMADWSPNHIKKQLEIYQRFLCTVLTQRHAQCSKAGKVEIDGLSEGKDGNCKKPKANGKKLPEPGIKKYTFDSDDLTDWKWRPELAWLTKALEPALQLYRRALPAGNHNMQQIPASPRSLAEIIASLQRSKVGIQDWSLSDLILGLYLIYLRQASADKVEDIKGVQISSETVVQDLIYHTELAKGAYKENAASLARNSMLREGNVLKFVKDSNVMRPGYYIGTDIRNKLVILGIRGTHTVYDLITDMVSSGGQEVTFEGFSTHFGTAEAARWLLHHEMGTIRKCLEKHEGFRLRLVGHSLGGAAAALLAIMLRKRSKEELGFSPDIVSAVGFGTPPCISKELAESCAGYVSNVVLQDDIVPRLSAVSLMRLRNEILQTDWMSILEKEDWKSMVDLVTNAKQVMSTFQDVARKCADYAKFKSKENTLNIASKNGSDTGTKSLSKPVSETSIIIKPDTAVPEELFVPGKLYHLKRSVEAGGPDIGKSQKIYTLWMANPGEHFEKIVLSSTAISDHKCDNHYYALRDVLKGLPRSDNRGIDIY